MTTEVHNIHELLNVTKKTAQGRDSVSIGTMLETIGRRSFGPILLLVGLIYSTPVLGDIPGVPTLLGAVVALIAVQLIVGKKHIWLPNVLLKRTVSSSILIKTVDWIRPYSEWIDKYLKPRLSIFSGRAAMIFVAVISILVAFLTPVMAVVPFSANVAGLALVLFGLGLVARDGLLNLIGFIIFLITVGLLIYFI